MTAQIGSNQLAIASAALDAFALPMARSISLISDNDNTVFLISVDSDKYVLRLHRQCYQSRQSIESELTWLKSLRLNANLIVPEAVASLAGQYVVEVPASCGFAGMVPRYSVLFKWIEGEFIGNRFHADTYRKLGAFIGQLHTNRTPACQLPSFTRPTWGVRNIVGRGDCDSSASAAIARLKFGSSAGDDWIDRCAASESSGLRRRERRIIEHAIAKIEATAPQGTPEDKWGLIHGDLQHRNFFLRGPHVGAIDFDDCGWGFYLYDLAVPLAWLVELPHYEELRFALLEGYGENGMLPNDTSSGLLAEIDCFIAVRVVFLMRWFSGWGAKVSIRSRMPIFMQHAVQHLKKFIR